MPDILQSSSREWLEANGLGGFAGTTVSGINTRRYHSVLTAAVKPPVVRTTLVNQYEEKIFSESGHSWGISAHQYGSPTDKNRTRGNPSIINPAGFSLLKKFSLYPWPVWTYQSDFGVLEKSVFMIYGQNATVTLYRLLESPHESLTLKVRPLMTGRDYHHTHHENRALNAAPKILPGTVSFAPYTGVPQIYFHHNGEFKTSFYWYRNFYYAIESERGSDCLEDCWTPGELIFTLKKGETCHVVASTEPKFRGTVETLQSEEKKRREKSAMLHGKPAAGSGLCVMRSADQLIVRRDKICAP